MRHSCCRTHCDAGPGQHVHKKSAPALQRQSHANVRQLAAEQVQSYPTPRAVQQKVGLAYALAGAVIPELPRGLETMLIQARVDYLAHGTVRHGAGARSRATQCVLRRDRGNGAVPRRPNTTAAATDAPPGEGRNLLPIS